jgi:chaperonin GroES
MLLRQRLLGIASGSKPEPLAPKAKDGALSCPRIGGEDDGGKTHDESSLIALRSITEHRWMKTEIRPLNDKILVRRSDVNEKTEQGIYLPDNVREKPREGDVLAVGAGILNKETGQYIPFDVKPGDHVMIGKYAGTEVVIDNTELALVPYSEILAVIG